MVQEVGPADHNMLLGALPNDNGNMAAREQPDRHGNHRKWISILILLTLLALALITVIVLAVMLYKSLCPDGWIKVGKKCYYFSEAEEDWTYSQSNCSSLGASLAVVDTMQDLDFVMRYKGKTQYWIGLQRRDPGHPWKWTDGTKFNNLFRIGADGDCAYLNDANKVSSLWCTSKRNWICSRSLPL